MTVHLDFCHSFNHVVSAIYMHFTQQSFAGAGEVCGLRQCPTHSVILNVVLVTQEITETEVIRFCHFDHVTTEI